MNPSSLSFALVTISLGTAVASSAEATPAARGVTYAGWRGEYGNADRKLATFKEIGFRIVSFVPTYAYTGLNKIDLASGPDAAELAKAVGAAARKGFAVVIKPHLDPLLYRPGFDPFQSENQSWRVSCPWRGFFDVDPMGDDYRSGVVFASLRAVRTAIDNLGGALAADAPELLAQVLEIQNGDGP